MIRFRSHRARDPSQLSLIEDPAVRRKPYFGIRSSAPPEMTGSETGGDRGCPGHPAPLETVTAMQTLTSRRTALRRQMTNAKKKIIAQIASQSPRGALSGLMAHYDNLIYEASQLQTAISDQETEEEAERQDNIHLE